MLTAIHEVLLIFLRIYHKGAGTQYKKKNYIGSRSNTLKSLIYILFNPLELNGIDRIQHIS